MNEREGNPNYPFRDDTWDEKDDDAIIAWLIADGFDEATAAYEVDNYRTRGLRALTDTPRIAITRALKELRA